MKIEQLIDFKHHQNLPWLKDSLLFLTKHGSHAYGLNTPQSDLDLKGVCCPPKQYFIGTFNHFEQAEGKNSELNVEHVIYDVRKFINLAADCNPNIIELLWTANDDLLFNSEEGEYLRAYRSEFLSKKARQSFAGYAVSQLKRIETHRKWILNPPQSPPSRKEMGLVDYEEISKSKFDMALDLINKKLNTYAINFDDFDYITRLKIKDRVAKLLANLEVDWSLQFESAAYSIGFGTDLVKLLKTESQYRNKQNEYKQYLNWKATRNKSRAELEEKFGLDTKHASHLVRLLLMCKEIAIWGVVIVKRFDKEKILGIRNGEKTYDEIMSWVDEQSATLNDLYQASNLPEDVDQKKLENLCIEIVEQRLWRQKC